MRQRARRIRRLIPAASLALLVTLAASVVWLPLTALGTAAREVIAAALYVENLRLAFTQAKPPRRRPAGLARAALLAAVHFYVLWPLLGMALWLATRLVRGHRHPENATRWSAGSRGPARA
ncbi:hypothetical protein ACIBG8_13430 [Nonomuraea sp. NPDC050556]|uniref:hypothetical protein n=1 Tax=Nonomuraea sp. NPDC050556 TaxID=3364369 RepID=UPI00379F0AAF